MVLLVSTLRPIAAAPLPRVRLSADGRGFVTARGKPFVPFGVSYYQPGTGWAPQVWKQFDPEATRRDFNRMKELGVNCVRVFLSYGSFQMETNRLSSEGLAKFDRFLDIAEESGIYVHPTGPDHWEGLPDWAKEDRYADEVVLRSAEEFWCQFAARYRGRSVIFAYDLVNEPEIRWDTGPMRLKWNLWLEQHYVEAGRLAAAWGLTNQGPLWGRIPIPPREDQPGSAPLLDFQHFREQIAADWTRRQAVAIKAADPQALATVGLIQWSIPWQLAAGWQYSGFRPEQVARWVDFLEIHFYPFANGFYQYGPGDDERNLAYLEGVVREVARPGKPVVLAEFGWYGGGRLTFGNFAPATQTQQAQWCRQLVESTAGLACGWINWGLHDHPQSGDVSQLTGLLTVGEEVKAWGREFERLERCYRGGKWTMPKIGVRPKLDWDRCLTSAAERAGFRERYMAAWAADRR